jgi:hypothetical protein
MQNKITIIQKKLIHMAKAELKIGDEEYRALLSERYWVNTCKDLSYKDASDLIDYFKTKGFKIRSHRSAVSHQQKRKPTAPNVTQLMSREQLLKIEHLKKDILWHAGPMGYHKWLMKYLKKDHITTSKEAQNVIEALKNMKARQNRRGAVSAPTGDEFHDYPNMTGGHYEW